MLRFSFLLLLLIGCSSPKKAQDDFVLSRGDTVPPVGVMWQSIQNNNDCEWITMFDDVPNPALAFLWASYGSDNTCLLKFFQEKRFKKIHVYLSNGSCIRKGNCSEREIASEVEMPIRAKQVANFVRNFCKSCALSIVPQLEDNFDNTTARRIGSEIRRVLKGYDYLLVRNPVRTTTRDDVFDAYEYHNEAPVSPCVWSNDGLDVDGIDDDVWNSPDTLDIVQLELQLDQYAYCDRYVWIAESNCLSEDSGVSPYPHQRVCDFEFYDEINELIKRKNNLQ